MIVGLILKMSFALFRLIAFIVFITIVSVVCCSMNGGGLVLFSS